MNGNGKLREKIKPLEYLINIHPNPKELKRIVLELTKCAESPVECTRMSFIHELVCPEEPFIHQDKLEKFTKENIILVLESLNRSFFKHDNIEQSKQLLVSCNKFLNISVESYANIYANALLSTYEVE